ncbi:MAG: peptidoglycan DD-metalloendopeptidase family protein [Flavobacteriales bacterium]|nr:peptidoglycan DD-metalloendopeptidase family protein [Flavobacteriales bacterium]
MFICVSVVAQNKETLKNQKIIIEKEIEYTSKLLETTQENKKSSLSYLGFLEKKITSQERLIQILNIEISLLQKQTLRLQEKIENSNTLIIKREKQIFELKKEYASMIYALQKNKNDRNSLMFVVSSTTFNQAYKRILYLKQYSRSRKNQAIQIEKNQDSLALNKQVLIQQHELLKNKKDENISLILLKKEKLKTILDSKEEKKIIFSKLQKSENLFLTKIKSQQKKALILDKKIKKIIEEEIRLARDRLRKNNNSNTMSLTPEARIISDNFSKNKGNLPWPLEQGLIVQSYGTQKHHLFNNVETFNNGINIATNKNANIRSVFDGKISRIFFIQGKGRAILINHGEFFTVYSGLEDVTVKLGDNILAKEKIGTVLTDVNDSKTELHFEIWKGYDKQDPSLWLFEAY